MIQEGIRTNKNYETFLLQMFCFFGLDQWCQTDPVKGRCGCRFSFQPSNNTPDPNQLCSCLDVMQPQRPFTGSVWHHWARLTGLRGLKNITSSVRQLHQHLTSTQRLHFLQFALIPLRTICYSLQQVCLWQDIRGGQLECQCLEGGG